MYNVHSSGENTTSSHIILWLEENTKSFVKKSKKIAEDPKKSSKNQSKIYSSFCSVDENLEKQMEIQLKIQSEMQLEMIDRNSMWAIHQA